MATTNTAGVAVDFRLLEAVGTVLLKTIEAEAVSMTYSLTRLLKQSIETQHSLLSFLSQDSDAVLPDAVLPSRAMDSLVDKLAAVIGELQRRNLAFDELAARIARLEDLAAAQDSVALEPSTIAVPEVRLHAIEDSLNSVELLAGGLGQQDQGLRQLDQRLSALENLLHDLMNLPETLERQSRAIERLDERLSNLEARHLVDQGLQERGIEPDRVL